MEDRAQQEESKTDRSQPPLLRRVGLALLGIAVLALLLGVVLVAPRLIVNLDRGHDAFNGTERVRAINDVRTTLLQGLAGAVLLLGAGLTWRQVTISREQLQHNVDASREERLVEQGQVTERFNRAVDQLGHGNLDVRLGGLYSLERIARDSEADRAAIYEILTAYVRGHAPWPPQRATTPEVVDESLGGLASQPDRLAPDQRLEDLPLLQIRAADVQAALTILGRRPRCAGDRRLDLARTDLRGADLEGAHPEKAYLRGTHLERAYLDGAHLEEADLEGAHLEQAAFINVYYERPSLGGAYVKGAMLIDVNLEGARLAEGSLGEASPVRLVTPRSIGAGQVGSVVQPVASRPPR
jgi:uncharacterized protein YjbI with pentapeptide repeats